jgi:hypothetical protein
VKRPVVITTPTAERPLLSDKERQERLQRLAERLLTPDGLDHVALERIEQLSGDEQ